MRHPTDDAKGVAAAVLDGLLLGCGDAVIGINPATDSPATVTELLHLVDDVRSRFDILTQTCVLTHVTTTLDLIGRSAPVDLVFQSIAGTRGGNEAFGMSVDMLAEARAAALGLGRAPSVTTSCTSKPLKGRPFRPALTSEPTASRSTNKLSRPALTGWPGSSIHYW